jgi:hypothetical protein
MRKKEKFSRKDLHNDKKYVSLHSTNGNDR